MTWIALLIALIALLVAPSSDEWVRRAAVREAAEWWGVDSVLALQVSLAENWSGDPKAVSVAGAVGIMQVMPSVWHGSPIAVGCIDRTGPPWSWHADLTEPRFNACVGVGVLAHYLERCHERRSCALVLYNGADTPGSRSRYLAAVQRAARRL